MRCGHTDPCKTEICYQPWASECFLAPFAMLQGPFSTWLPFQLPVLLTDLWIASCVCFLKGEQPSLSQWCHLENSYSSFKSSLSTSLPLRRLLPLSSDRMRSLCFHICIADSVFLGHSTFCLELQLLLLIALIKLQTLEEVFYIFIYFGLLQITTQWGLFFSYKEGSGRAKRISQN